jgi:hypothetical protein
VGKRKSGRAAYAGRVSGGAIVKVGVGTLRGLIVKNSVGILTGNASHAREAHNNHKAINS